MNPGVVCGVKRIKVCCIVFISLFVELLVAKTSAYKTIHEQENMPEADNSVQKI